MWPRKGYSLQTLVYAAWYVFIHLDAYGIYFVHMANADQSIMGYTMWYSIVV